MTRTVLRNFAIYAREKLIENTRTRASMMGITEDGIQPPLSKSESGDELIFETGTASPFAISGDEVRQYRALIDEPVSYTHLSQWEWDRRRSLWIASPLSQT